MKNYTLVFILFVISVEVKADNEGNTAEGKHWDWTYLAVTETSPLQQESPDGQYNPCTDETYSTKPDYSSSSRRISEIKCFEYVWEIQLREEQEKRAQQCTQFQIKNGRPLFRNFAIGGHPTLPGEYPHMGAIGWKAAIGTWVFKCGGSLISPKFVLTAAHCSSISSGDTTIEDPLPKIVRLGDKNILDTFDNGVTPTDANIIKIINHPNYESPKKYYDISLMELEKTITFTKYIQPACLWGRHDLGTLGTSATLTGWGVVETASRTTSPELQAAVVDLVPSKTCDLLLGSSCNRHFCGLQSHQLCAGKLEGGVDACQGDSGGPLQVKIPLNITNQGSMHFVIGVTSFGIGCALPNLPGIYTRVSSFVDWIEDNVWVEKYYI